MKSKRRIDKVTSKWAHDNNVKIWEGSDGKIYASDSDDSGSVQVALTAREALALVLKKRDGVDVNLPPAPPRKPRLSLVIAIPDPFPPAQAAAGSEENNNEGNDSAKPIPSPPVAPPAVKSGSSKPEARPRIDKGINGVQYQIKSRVALNESATIDQILEEVRAAGFKTTRGTVMGLRSGVLHTMRVLRAIGMMEPKK